MNTMGENKTGEAPVERRTARPVCSECGKRHWLVDHELTMMYFRVLPTMLVLAAVLALVAE